MNRDGGGRNRIQLVVAMGSRHAIIVPLPAQGHVIPLIALSHSLVAHGFRITFINSEFNHEHVVASLSQNGGDGVEGIQMVSFPDGLAPREDRNDIQKLTEGIRRVMPGHLEELIKQMNTSKGDRVSCVIADGAMGWALQVAQKMGIRSAAFWPASAALHAIFLHIPEMIQDGIIDANGMSERSETFQLSPGMPSVHTSQLPWNCAGNLEAERFFFKCMLSNNQGRKLAETIICNSFYDLESPSFTLFPNLLPVGPLLTSQQFGKAVGHFWQVDTTCMSWLDEQPANSVIYAAFGSLAVFNQHQFQELALGLELSGRPFLWVVRHDLTDRTDDAWLDGFRDRVKGQGKLVGWSPQQQVLAHPSIACFFSHCGWNSTLEGVKNGVPFLCWPYFADQFLNRSYICDVWKTGLNIDPDDKGFVPKEQIKEKGDQIFLNEEMKARALMWKDIANRCIKEGGSSYKNFKSFVDSMKE
ncbi:UDP-glycosyltransferase 83A1-like [Elaeis guineensis]|uniref:UDP-glycosyltransferase 83A1-like n=1 Tax=Elaeis guineensis var. tenera TaxID=51953 RepID=A0A8N4EXG5_ELAGV|nr:UDP-glycosyltransferase 83A1-like [Elaeis guineensis]